MQRKQHRRTLGQLDGGRSHSASGSASPLPSSPHNNLVVLGENRNYRLHQAERGRVGIRSPKDKKLPESVRNAINKMVEAMLDPVKNLFRVRRSVAGVMRDSPGS